MQSPNFNYGFKHGKNLMYRSFYDIVGLILSNLAPFTSNWVENKLLLLEAELFASQCNREAALKKYEASIKSARDHGFVHEQGLAYEVSFVMLSLLSSILMHLGT